jgi:hypothetical protein
LIIVKSLACRRPSCLAAGAKHEPGLLRRWLQKLPEGRIGVCSDENFWHRGRVTAFP